MIFILDWLKADVSRVHCEAIHCLDIWTHDVATNVFAVTAYQSR